MEDGAGVAWDVPSADNTAFPATNEFAAATVPAAARNFLRLRFEASEFFDMALSKL